MGRFKQTMAALVALALPGLVAAAGDPMAGKAKAALCASCHGADGNGAGNPLWPKLAGQHADYIAKQLADFKAQRRTDATMASMVAGLSESDMANLGAYYASLEGSVDGAKADAVEAGEKLYRGGIAAKDVAACASCHGPAGGGNPSARFPSLSGQSAAYTAKTLKDFRSGTRANDPQGMMRDVVTRMTDGEIEAVSEYLAGLH